MMRFVFLLTVAIATACAAIPPQQGTGWTVDPNYHAPTTVQIFLYGPATDVAAVITEGGPLGWKVIERSALPSGSALALVEGPISPKPDAYIDHIIGNRKVTFGPALRPEDRRPAQPR